MKKNPNANFISSIIALLLALITCCASASEPILDITFGGQAQRLSRTELLKHPALKSIEVKADVAYKREMHYKAIPLTALMPSLSKSATLQFVALDGFVANIPGDLLTGDAQAWLAIESSDLPWPALKHNSTSAGPFYLVWLLPEKMGISPEQWPYQIAKIAEASRLEDRYPQIQAKINKSSAVLSGMHVFIANCAVCHKINGGGDAELGPDLNKPFSPTEYFQEPYLRKLIRDPASVRNWHQRAMPGFSNTVISDVKLDDLMAYFRQMAKER